MADHLNFQSPVLSQAQRAIQTAWQALGFEPLNLDSITFEKPADPSHGDYSTNIALSKFKQIEGYNSPRALGEAIVAKLPQAEAEFTASFSGVSVAGPGFINFQLAPTLLWQQAVSWLISPDKMLPALGNDQKIIVEYSSPNIAKPFTIGHLRSTIIGHAVANLYEALRFTVYRDNHLGDWGTQFGKQIYAIKTWGNEAELDQAERPVKELVKLYVKFHDEAEKNPALEDEGRAWFKKLEDGDAEARRLWEKCITWSLKEFKGLYHQLGVSFTENNGQGYGESYFEDKMGPIVAELETKGLLTDSEGAKLIFYPDEQYPPLMIIKKDGTTLYATRDLATDHFRLEKYGQDVIIANEVGAEQALYFRQLFKAEEMLGWFKPGQRVHIKHGMYRFKDMKMSTRKGNVIWLEEVLAEAVKRAEAISPDQKLAAASYQAIGLGALKWNDLKRSSHLDIVFDWDELLNLKGNSGPYLQYTYVRCFSVLSKATSTQLVEPLTELGGEVTPEELALLRQFYLYPEVVVKAAQEYAPHHVCTYLYELAQAFNTFYNSQQILAAELAPEVRSRRLALTKVVAEVLKQGLGLLGIEVVEKM